MDTAALIEHLKQQPEAVRLSLVYPDLPDPIPFATAYAYGPVEEDPDAPEWNGLYNADFEVAPNYWRPFVIPKEHHRIVEEYEAARERQEEAEEECAAARWNRPTEAELAARAEAAIERQEAVPEAVPPNGKLRRARLCSASTTHASPSARARRC